MAGAKSYLLPTAGSIDATDIVPHDRGIIRACRAICISKIINYEKHSILNVFFVDDPDRDPKIAGDAKCTVFLVAAPFLFPVYFLEQYLYFRADYRTVPRKTHCERSSLAMAASKQLKLSKTLVT